MPAAAVGKTSFRQWTNGGSPTTLRTRKKERSPSLGLCQWVNKIGIRKLIRQDFGRRIIEKISRREFVKASTYREYERGIEEYARRRRRPKRSV